MKEQRDGQSLSNGSSLSREKWYVLILGAIQFAHILDFVILMPLGPTLIKEFAITSGQFGTLVSSYNFAAGSSGLFFGVIADRYDRKKLLFFAMTFFIIGTLACAFTAKFSTLLVARIIAGLFGGILNAQVFAIATDLIPIERRGRAIGKIMTSFSVASVIGVPLGLAISDHFGWSMSFLFIAILGMIITISAQAIIPNLNTHVCKTGFKETFSRYVKIILNKNYQKPIIMLILLAGSIFCVVPYLSPYGVANIGISISDLKYMYFIAGIVTMGYAVLMGKLTDKYGAFNVFWRVAIISFIPMYLYTNAGPMNFFWYALLGSFFMSSLSGRMIPGMTLITQVPEQSERGSFMSLLNSLRSFGSASSTLLGGYIISEASDGKIQNFNYVGYLAIFATMTAILISRKVNQYVQNKS